MQIAFYNQPIQESTFELNYYVLDNAKTPEIRQLINYHLKAITDQGRALAVASNKGASGRPFKSLFIMDHYTYLAQS